MVTKSMMGVFQQFSRSRAETWNDPPHATSSKYKARAEHEREIE
jgi:hypothetical protein